MEEREREYVGRKTKSTTEGKKVVMHIYTNQQICHVNYLLNRNVYKFKNSKTLLFKQYENKNAARRAYTFTPLIKPRCSLL